MKRAGRRQDGLSTGKVAFLRACGPPLNWGVGGPPLALYITLPGGGSRAGCGGMPVRQGARARTRIVWHRNRGKAGVNLVNYYMSLSYEVDVVHEESGDAPPYVAFIRELPGCMAQGRTPAEALEELQQAKYLFIEAMLDHGVPIPSHPRSNDRYDALNPLSMYHMIGREM